MACSSPSLSRTSDSRAKHRFLPSHLALKIAPAGLKIAGLGIQTRNMPPDGSNTMTIDKSLKIKAGSVRTRNVLTRAERLEKLQENGRWAEGDSVIGLPKVRVQKISLKKKKKVKKEEEKADDADAAAT